MQQKVLFWSLILLGLFLFLPASALTADHLVISQVQMTGGSGKTTNDFIEIYNPTDQDIDLEGMRLVKRTKIDQTDTPLKSWTTSNLIRAHGFYLWANSGFTDLTVPADVTTSGSIANDNGVALRKGPNDAGQIIDSLAWGEATNAFVEGTVFPTNLGANESLERKPGGGLGNGEDSNNNSQDFFLQAIAHPRNSQSSTEPPLAVVPPPSPPPTSGAGGSGTYPVPEITEFLPNPPGRDSGFEWVELYNSNSLVLDLSGWYLDDETNLEGPGKNAFAIPQGTNLESSQYLAILIPKGKFSLNNSGGDILRLFDNTKVQRLRLAYSETAKEGFSYAKDANGAWSWTDTPTPGATNNFPIAAVFSSTLRISEVLPNPVGDDSEDEFIEIFNFGSDSVDLADWVVADSRKRYVINEEDFSDTELGPQRYFVLYREITGITLNNSGEEEVSLFDPQGKLVDRIRFEAGPMEGASFARKDNVAYEWTAVATPSQENQFVEVSKSALKKEEAPQGAQAPKSKTEIKEQELLLEAVSLKELRSSKVGSKIKTRGVISVEPGIFGADTSYLAGSGIRIFFEDPNSLDLKVGDEIELSGELASYHNELQLKVSGQAEIKVLNTNLPLNPEEIKTGDIGESLEGSLVKVTGAFVRRTGDAIFLNDGSGEARIYLKASTGIALLPLKKGQEIQVTGIVSQFDENYRIMPRYKTDLVFDPISSRKGNVLGAKRENSLPRTGINFWLVLAIFMGFCYISLWFLPKLSRKICLDL